MDVSVLVGSSFLTLSSGLMSVFSVSFVAHTGLILRHLFIFLSGDSHIFTENYHSLFLSLLSRFGFSSSLDNSLSPKLLLFLIAAAQMCAVLDNRTLTALQLQLSAPICDSCIDPLSMLVV